MRKGDLVKLNPGLFSMFETTSSALSIFDMRAGRYPATRPLSEKEIKDWYTNSQPLGVNSAGESRLPPRTKTIYLYKDRFYTVVKARARATLGWTVVGGLTKVMCSFTGEEVYIKRKNLVPA